MTLLQTISPELISQATEVTPYGYAVYKFVVGLLLAAVLGLITVLWYYVKKYDALVEKVHGNAVEQTKTFTSLSGYMGRHNGNVEELLSLVEKEASKSEETRRLILRRISTVAIKLQRDEQIQEPDA